MLNNIDLLNYRGFEKYRVTNATRVNLFVGRNNCGKTSILEAIHLLASAGNPSVIVEIAERRGEILLSEGNERYAPSRRNPVITHFFHGHSIRPGATFQVESGGKLGRVTARIINVEDSELGQQSLFFGEQVTPTLAVQIEGSKYPAQPMIPISDEGALSSEMSRRLMRSSRLENEAYAPVTFISPESLEQDSMSSMWNRVILQGKESEVFSAMRILEPRLTGIYFLSGVGIPRYAGSAGILVGLEDQKERLLLGSYGDGMRRLLALSIALIKSSDGYLLLDEIDTGLHYSIMGEMWKLVVGAAIQSNVQVYATTHSLDCIYGLSWLAKSCPELFDEVTVHKIEPSLDASISLQGSQLIAAIEQEMEIR